MSFMNPSDMVEEDAADLQFPKDTEYISVTSSSLTKHTVEYYHADKEFVFQADIDFAEKCCVCFKKLKEPFIKCAECSNFLCLRCFSGGAETQYHRNIHSYIIVHDNVQVFPNSNWTGSEEKQLLNLLITCGYSNWENIAKRLKNRTANECEEHYHTCYFDGIFKKLLGLSKEYYFPEKHPLAFKIHGIDPPRYDIDSINFQNLAGYRCARGDFDVPYDNSAESIVSHLEISDWRGSSKFLRNELHYAILKAFNHKIAERSRRHKIMRAHGLLMTNKTLRWLSNYSEALGILNGNVKFGSTGRFVAFMQLTNGIAFDNLIESMQNFIELKKYIYKLYEMRSNGVTTFYGGKVYQKLKNKRWLKLRNNKRVEQYETSLNWRNFLPNHNQAGNDKTCFNNFISSCSQPRRKAAPIDILGLPECDKLTEDERTLCSTSRVLPIAYLEYKNMLMSENAKVGFVRLADARRLIKIDVNKTRQIYDFLLNNGFINKPF